jgi:hypothetical protein
LCSLGDLSPKPLEEWLALVRKLQDAPTGQMSLPGMADEDPELERLVKNLPSLATPGVEVSNFEATATSPADLVSVHLDRVTFENPWPAGHIHVGHEFWKRLG